MGLHDRAKCIRALVFAAGLAPMAHAEAIANKNGAHNNGMQWTALMGRRRC